MKTNHLLFVIIAFLTVIVVYLFYRDGQRDREMAVLLSRQNLPASKDGRPVQDPYLQNEVKNRIIKGYGELQVCYNEYLGNKPTITDGEIKMDWQIDTSGETISPEVITSPFSDEDFHGCLIRQIDSWDFPAPLVQKYVTHAFRFEKNK